MFFLKGSNNLHTENENESYGTIESLRQQAHKNNQQIRMRKKSMILNQARKIYPPTEKLRSWDKNLNASDICHINTSISSSSSTSSESSMSPGVIKFSKNRSDERLMPYKILPNCVHKSNASLLSKNNSHGLIAQSQCQQKKLSGTYSKVKSVPSLVEPMSLPYSSYEYLLPFYLSIFSPMNQNHITQQIKSIKQKQYEEQLKQQQESQKQQQQKQSRHMQQQHQNQLNYTQQHEKQQRYQQQQQKHCQLQRKQTTSKQVNAVVKSEQEKVDEHFKRSLGVVYVKLFQDHSSDANNNDKNNRDVDEHFAKALGAETWKQLKQTYSNCQISSSMPMNKKQSSKFSYFKT